MESAKRTKQIVWAFALLNAVVSAAEEGLWGDFDTRQLGAIAVQSQLSQTGPDDVYAREAAAFNEQLVQTLQEASAESLGEPQPEQDVVARRVLGSSDDEEKSAKSEDEAEADPWWVSQIEAEAEDSVKSEKKVKKEKECKGKKCEAGTVADDEEITVVGNSGQGNAYAYGKDKDKKVKKEKDEADKSQGSDQEDASEGAGVDDVVNDGEEQSTPVDEEVYDEPEDDDVVIDDDPVEDDPVEDDPVEDPINEEEEEVEEMMDPLLCISTEDAYIELLFQGNLQKEQGLQQALSFTYQYAQLFNMSIDPTSPVIQATADSMYTTILLQMKGDPLFIRTVFIQTPTVGNVPEGCRELELDYLQQVETLMGDLQDTADMGNYLLNPQYPPAGDMLNYFRCRNSIFSGWCYPEGL